MGIIRHMTQYERRTLVKMGIIQGVLQLPKPRRLGLKEYPAALILGQGQECIRMVYMSESTKQVKNPLDFGKCLKLLQGVRGSKKESFLVSVDDVLSTQDTRLNPSYYSVAKEKYGKSYPLEHYAEVLRCQAERIPHEGSAEDARGDASLVHEVSLSELEISSGFLPLNVGKLVRVKFTDKQKKHLLQAGDSIFSYRGSPVSIGKNGFVPQVDTATIVGTAMCIIRPKQVIHAVWLHAQLNTPVTQAWIKAHVIGKSPFISTEEIKKIPIPPYDKKQADTIEVLHRQITESFIKITTEQGKIRQCLSRMKAVTGA